MSSTIRQRRVGADGTGTYCMTVTVHFIIRYPYIFGFPKLIAAPILPSIVTHSSGESAISTITPSEILGALPDVQVLNRVSACQVIVSSNVRDEYVSVLFPPTIVTATGIIRVEVEVNWEGEDLQDICRNEDWQQ
jgi:hypothetical protein